MKTARNLGHHERILRLAIGFILLALSGFSMFPGWGDLLLMAGGLMALLTGLVGYCPAWHAVGINTCNVGQRQHSGSHTKGGPHGPTTSPTPPS